MRNSSAVAQRLSATFIRACLSPLDEGSHPKLAPGRGNPTLSLRRVWYTKTWALFPHYSYILFARVLQEPLHRAVRLRFRIFVYTAQGLAQSLQAEGTGLPEAWPHPNLGEDRDLCCFRTRLQVEKARVRPCQCAKVVSLISSILRTSLLPSLGTASNSHSGMKDQVAARRAARHPGRRQTRTATQCP